MESSIKEKYLIWTAVGLAICVISLGVTIIIGSDFGHDNFIRLIVFVCSNVFGWLVYLVFQSFIFDAYHIYKLKFGKKEKPLEVEAVAPQEVIAPMAEETAIAEETSDKEPVQESLPIEIHITSQHHQKRKASYEEMQKQEMEQRVRMVIEYIHYIMPRIADQETINYICTEVHNWMNHDTGKSCKLNDNDMMEIQTSASEILEMERGQSKAETGKEHLERNDFILEKQKSELRNLDAVMRYKEYQVKCAEQEVQEAESITQALRDEALQKEKQSEMLDKAISDKRSKLNKEKGNQLLGAVADWATGKSKALKGDIEDLKFDLAEAHETIAEERKRTQAETAKLEAYKKTVAQQMESAVRNATLKKDDEINNLKDRISWRDKMLGMFTKILMQSNGTFRKAVDSIINFAKDTYRSIFSREEAKTIKSVMEAFGKNKEDYRAIGTFLVFTADKKENLSNSEYRKAVREVDDVAIGRYEQAQKRGNSLKL